MKSNEGFVPGLLFFRCSDLVKYIHGDLLSVDQILEVNSALDQ
jgi:hypothetical protein